MGAYALGILLLMKFLIEVVLAEVFSVAGILNCIKDYWANLLWSGKNTVTSLTLRNLIW